MPPLLQLPLPLLLQRLGELLVSSTAIFPGGRRQPGVEALRRVLEDPAVFYRVRCDAALALAGLRDEQGQAVGECGRLCRWMRPEIYLQASVRCFGGHGRLLLQVCSAFECVPLPTAPPPLSPPPPHPAGLPLLLDCYRRCYFLPGSDLPASICVADPSAYLVAQAVVTAGESQGARSEWLCPPPQGRRGYQPTLT